MMSHELYDILVPPNSCNTAAAKPTRFFLLPLLFLSTLRFNYLFRLLHF